MRPAQIIFLLIIVCIPLLLAEANVGDTITATGPQVLETGSIGALIFRMLLTLSAIIAVILATVWVLKRLTTRRWPGKSKERPIRIIDRIQLAPKRSLDVVVVGKRVILLGVTENGINLLTELSAEEISTFQPQTVGQAGFRTTLTEAKERMQQVFARARAALPENAISTGTSLKTL